MSFIERHLRPGERVLYRTRAHWAVFIVPLLVVLAILPLYYFCYGYFVHGGGQWMDTLAGLMMNDHDSLTIFGILAVIWLLLFGWPMVKGLYKVLTGDVTVTNQRVIFRHGLILKCVKEMQHDWLEGIEIDQTLLGQLFNYGHLRIISVGMEHADLYNIADPAMLRSLIVHAASGDRAEGPTVFPRGRLRRVMDRELVKAA